MINVIGLGYIGLPTALMMASHGVEVIGTDYNKQLVDIDNKHMKIMDFAPRFFSISTASIAEPQIGRAHV